MKFTVSQSSLADAIATVQKGVATSSTLPILAGVLIRATDGVLEFQTSNYTTSIRHRIAAHVEEEGATVIPCKMLANLIKTLPDAAVAFETVDRQIAITCQKSHVRLNTLDPADFPEFPAYAIEASVELPMNILTEMTARVWRVTSTDKARPILGGVHMTVENNILSVMEMSSFTKAERKERLESLIDEFNLHKVRKSLGIQLSGGERRRCEIARALAIDPKFILLDEPFAGVDPIAVEDIQHIIARLKYKNIGVIITDHNVGETLAIIDRAYLLYEGNILQSGTPEELAADEEVRTKYLGSTFVLKRSAAVL